MRPQDGGTRLFLGAQHLDVSLTLEQLENVLAGREPDEGDEGGGAGFTGAESLSAVILTDQIKLYE